MNVYDFDKTVYDGDSTLDFYIYCLFKQPLLIFYFPVQLLALLKYHLKIIDKLQYKETFYGFLKYIRDPEHQVENFWDKNEKKIQIWFQNQRQGDDVIISASPEFLIKPICQRLHIYHVIASAVDINSGKCLGPNCYGIEKVNRFKKEFPNQSIINFYSDSLSDTPIATEAINSFLVKKNFEQILWHQYKPSFVNKTINLFLNKEFFFFLLVGIVNTLNGIIIASIFSLVMNGNIAFIFGYLFSLLISFMLNSKFVFKESIKWNNFYRFALAYLPNFLTQLFIVFVLLNIYQVHEVFTYLISAVIGVPVTFVLIKLYAFKK